MTKEEFLILYKKFLSGNCSPDETDKINSYRDEMKLLDNTWESGPEIQAEVRERILKRLLQNIGQSEIKTTNTGIYWLKIAAVLVIGLSAALLFWKYQMNLPLKNELASLNRRVKIRPGGNKACLTMANGKQIILNDVNNGKIASQAGMQITKLRDGMLVYKQEKSALPEDGTSENTITTPRGGQYQIILSDGTKVWLNSATSLKYTPVFKGNERKVELNGEAYFEVAKNPAKPFKVFVEGMNIQVLGTHFNVKAYQGAKIIETTLLEGSVKLSNAERQDYLKAGQQAVLTSQSSVFNIKEVDVDEAVAWKNGLFAFKNENIRYIMDDISKWYDVDVEFRGDIDNKKIGGTVSKFKEVSEVLKTLELTGAVHFKIEGRRIIVMP